MAFTASQHDGVLVLTTDVAEIDSGNSARVRSELLKAIGPAPKVVLDLRNLKFLDSSGLGTILSAMRHVTSNGGELKISNVTRPVQAILELVRFHRIVEILDTQEDAVSTFVSES